MNISANMLGLDNAATPLGIKAMKELQTLNPQPDTASNAQILFLVINTAGVTLFPVTILTYRAQLGAANPSRCIHPDLDCHLHVHLNRLISRGLGAKNQPAG